MSDLPLGAPSRSLRVRAAGGWERFMRRAEGEGTYPVGPDGYEEHPLLRARVRDTASKGEGELAAVTHELHSDGRVVRIAHIRPESGIEWTTLADNVQAALLPVRERTTAENTNGVHMTTAVRPWGMGRLAPYPQVIELPFARTEIDPDTQTTRYFDADGRCVEWGTHGTSSSTSSATSTGADGGGAQPPAPADADSIDDTASD